MSITLCNYLYIAHFLHYKSQDKNFDLEGAYHFDAAHGFMDSYGPNYDSKMAREARKLIDEFLDRSF